MTSVRAFLAVIVGSVLLFGVIFLPRTEERAEETRGPGLRDGPAAERPMMRRRAGPGGGATGASGRARTVDVLLERWIRARKSERRRILHTFRSQRSELAEHLAEVLSDEDGRLFLAAIEVTGHLRIGEHEWSLVDWSLEHRPEVRAAAIRALTHYNYFDREVLIALLTDDEPLVLMAALEAAALTDDRPVDIIVRLLRHENREVAKRAFDAIPEVVGSGEIEALCVMAGKDLGPATILAIRALGGIEPSPRIERCLLETARSPQWTMRKAGLEALALQRSPLSDPAAVWSVVDNPEASVIERIRALWVLERRGPVEAARVRAAIPRLHPVEQLYAARCLVTIGDAGAVPVLIELLGTEISESADDEDRDYAIDGARRILTELAGEDLGLDSDSWRQWYRVVRPLDAVKLRGGPPLTW